FHSMNSFARSYRSQVLISPRCGYRFGNRLTNFNPHDTKIHGRHLRNFTMERFKLSELLIEMNKNIDLLSRAKDWKHLKKNLENTERELQKPEDVWNNPSVAAKLQRHSAKIQREVEIYEKLTRKVTEVKELIDLAKEENDQGLFNVILNDAHPLNQELKIFTLTSLMNDDADQNGCIVQITPGAGGIDSSDWAEMLYKMYVRWGTKNGFQVKTLDYVNDEIAGCKSASLKIDGDYAYGWTKYESGIHRLVRISPFDAQNRRHTSFASVVILPSVEDEIDGRESINIRSSDLKIETFRSSGAGGQHVNVTASAVRITHTPTKIVVQCQNERSQHSNKSTAMEILRARLYDRMMREKKAEKHGLHSSLPENAWGSQIRSYILYPYQLIKDSRTGHETSQVDSVLNDGELDEFLEASLTHFKQSTI
ncbi:16250_t:CDS:10, partial [Acaulospora morrowiae]